MTETPDDHEIIERQATSSISGVAAPRRGRVLGSRQPYRPRLSPRDLQTAQQFFDQLAAKSCDPLTVPGDCIPFMYPDNGCWARTHEMCRLLIEWGQQPAKVWIYGDLEVRTANHPNCEIPGWRYHVAPTLPVMSINGIEDMVIDPSLFFCPVRQDQWKRVQSDPSAVIVSSDASVYYRNRDGTYVLYDDAEYTDTRKDLKTFRDELKLRSAPPNQPLNPPPYTNCHPNIYLRDNLQDTGQEPLVTGNISASSDINHFRQELTDPQATLGRAAAQAQDTLFEPIEIGQPNYIYLRLQNCGYAAAAVDVDVYYALPSTLPTPTGWNLIGSLTTPPIVPGEFKVVGPLVWNNIPQQGHYCFVAVLGNAQDPKPDIASVHNIDEFYDFIKAHNNVTWKNFRRVQPVCRQPPDVRVLDPRLAAHRLP